MEINWDLLKKAEDDIQLLNRAFKESFFGSEENKNYFYEVEADAFFTSSTLKIQTPYNTYTFNKKLDGTFVFKKDKIEQYVYDISGKYSFENWKKLISEAEEDFAEVLAISEDVLAWLDKNTKRTMTQSMSKGYKKLFNSWFGKKEQQASIEYKEEAKEEATKELVQEDNKENVVKSEDIEKKEENEKSK